MDTSVSPGADIHNITESKVEDSSLILAVMGMLSFFSVLGTAGNSLVLYVYIRKRHKLASTVFIISLATTDFMTCLVVVPYTIAIEYLRYYVQYDFVCKLYMFFITSNVPFAAFIMVAIAFDRYLCIVHPFKHLVNARRAKKITTTLAISAFILGILTSLNYGVYQRRKCGVLNKTFNLTSLKNSTSTFPIESENCIEYTGVCEPTEVIFCRSFTNNYQKVYFALFLLAFFIVVVLYSLIYRSVLIQRAKRRKQRTSSGSLTTTRESWFSETRASFGFHNGSSKRGQGSDKISEHAELARQMTIRERGLIANIRTAAMLFVVTAVFIIAFLPAWLMAHELITYNIIIFYTYFLYNVANPMIYAFMNKAFRRDLREVFDCKSTRRDMI